MHIPRFPINTNKLTPKIRLVLIDTIMSKIADEHLCTYCNAQRRTKQMGSELAIPKLHEYSGEEWKVDDDNRFLKTPWTHSIERVSGIYYRCQVCQDGKYREGKDIVQHVWTEHRGGRYQCAAKGCRIKYVDPKDVRLHYLRIHSH